MIFTEEQIAFMESIGIHANFQAPTDDEILDIEDKVSDHLQTKGFTEDYEPTEEGRLCESILDVTSKNP